MIHAVLPAAVFIAAMLWALVSDAASMTISNRLCGVFAAAFPVLALSFGLGTETIALHALAALATLAIGFGFFAAGWMGGGDAKFLAAVALWLGPTAAFADYLTLSALLGGVLTLLILLARALVRRTTGVPAFDRIMDRSSGIPYGIALGSAGILVCASRLAS